MNYEGFKEALTRDNAFLEDPFGEDRIHHLYAALGIRCWDSDLAKPKYQDDFHDRLVKANAGYVKLCDIRY